MIVRLIIIVFMLEIFSEINDSETHYPYYARISRRCRKNRDKFASNRTNYLNYTNDSLASQRKSAKNIKVSKNLILCTM